MLGECPICGKGFDKKRGNITCSKTCSNAWRSKTMKGLLHKPFIDKTRICPICGSEFQAKRKEIATCSSKCGHLLQATKISGKNNSNYNNNLPIINCEHCNKPFRAHKSVGREIAKYCSKACSDLDKVKPKKILICMECGKTFSRNRWKVDETTKMYCSRECYIKNINLRSYKVDLMVEWCKEKGLVIEEEKSFPWLKNSKGYNLYIDLFIPSFNIGIEYDGRHHFKPTFQLDTTTMLDHRKYLDGLKNTLCENNGIKLFRFRYDEQFDKNYFFNKLDLDLFSPGE